MARARDIDGGMLSRIRSLAGPAAPTAAPAPLRCAKHRRVARATYATYRRRRARAPKRGIAALTLRERRRVARAEHAEHATHGAGPPTRPDPARSDRPIAGRSRLLRRTGPHPSPAPMRRTNHRRVARAEHAKHATNGRPIGHAPRTGLAPVGLKATRRSRTRQRTPGCGPSPDGFGRAERRQVPKVGTGSALFDRPRRVADRPRPAPAVARRTGPPSRIPCRRGRTLQGRGNVAGPPTAVRTVSSHQQAG
jgi:hypothetical protein